MNKLRKVTLSFILSLLLITGVMPAGTTSGMKNPSKIKKADAVSKGYTACKKCY